MSDRSKCGCWPVSGRLNDSECRYPLDQQDMDYLRGRLEAVEKERDELRADWRTQNDYIAGEHARLAEKDSELRAAREACSSTALFIERFLAQLEHRDTKDKSGRVVNGFAGAFIPDWELRQRLDDVKAALTPGGTNDQG